MTGIHVNALQRLQKLPQHLQGQHVQISDHVTALRLSILSVAESAVSKILLAISISHVSYDIHAKSAVPDKHSLCTQ